MSDAHDAIRYLLISDATLSGLVGQRVRPSGSGRTADALPYVTYRRISGATEHHQGGSTGTVHCTYQMDAYGVSPGSARDVADAVDDVLDGLANTVGAVGNQIKVLSCFQTLRLDEFEAPDTGDEQSVYRTVLQYEFWYREV